MCRRLIGLVMIEYKQIIEFIELNPTINKRLNSKLLQEIHIQEFNKPVKDMKCGSCVQTALNSIRVKFGYESKNEVEHKTIVKERLLVCGSCEYMIKGGFMGLSDTCGTFLNKLLPNPQLTNEGVKLCGCVLRGKAELGRKMIVLMGGCPANKWKV